MYPSIQSQNFYFLLYLPYQKELEEEEAKIKKKTSASGTELVAGPAVDKLQILALKLESESM